MNPNAPHESDIKPAKQHILSNNKFFLVNFSKNPNPKAEATPSTVVPPPISETQGVVKALSSNLGLAYTTAMSVPIAMNEPLIKTKISSKITKFQSFNATKAQLAKFLSLGSLRATLLGGNSGFSRISNSKGIVIQVIRMLLLKSNDLIYSANTSPV